jgi:selenide, water dikinase
MSEEMLLCKNGGCTTKLGPDILSSVLGKLPKSEDPNVLVSFDSSDDAAVYRLTDDLAFVQTLDFSPPMVDDPYIFGKIAAANALSDIYAMGGAVKTALNIVCFPEMMDLNVLGQIMRGGSEKVREAGGTTAGGHTIVDGDVKYGLSVTGIIHPDKIYRNNTCKDGDLLILSKPLGVGIICTAHRTGCCSKEAIDLAVLSMTTLNKYASEIISKYQVNACTDVTGFGFLGHLMQMLGTDMGAEIDSIRVPYIREAVHYANKSIFTAAAQKNRNYVWNRVEFRNIPFAMEEILFDAQTSGGLLISLPRKDAELAINEIESLGLSCGIVGQVTKKNDEKIIVK